jgi:anthraniloyl-CoA monooxygenase
MSCLFCAAGADLIDCSSGHVSKAEKLVYGRRFQVPFPECMRNGIDISTIAAGNIFQGDHVNTIIAAGRADLCAIARLDVPDMAQTLHKAAKQGHTDEWRPKQYLSDKLQFEHNDDRARLLLKA